MGTPESLANVKAIIEGQSEPCIVTVSALGGLTDCLIATAESASLGDAEYARRHEEICRRHRRVCEAVISAERLEGAWGEVSALLEELGTIFRAIYLLRELTERSKDLVVSYGERMSCIIVNQMIEGSELANSLEFVRTRRKYGKSVLDQQATSELIAVKFAQLRDAKVVIVPGFISKDEEGRISNLGRGGSDYTAAILAAESGARVLEIWTDVDGFMSADPRVVKEAQVIDRLSFAEAMELCNFGAKVVYPPTLYPVFHKNIPILIKNTFNPMAPGTLIGDNHDGKVHEESAMIGVSAIADTRLITLTGCTDKTLYAKMINALTGKGIETLMPDGKRSCGVRGSDAAKAKELLEEEFAVEISTGSLGEVSISAKLSTPALVGRRGMVSADIAEKLASALNVEGIPLAYAPQRATPDTVACMVDSGNLNAALQIIHSKFIK